MYHRASGQVVHMINNQPNFAAVDTASLQPAAANNKQLVTTPSLVTKVKGHFLQLPLATTSTGKIQPINPFIIHSRLKQTPLFFCK